MISVRKKYCFKYFFLFPCLFTLIDNILTRQNVLSQDKFLMLVRIKRHIDWTLQNNLKLRPIYELLLHSIHKLQLLSYDLSSSFVSAQHWAFANSLKTMSLSKVTWEVIAIRRQKLWRERIIVAYLQTFTRLA